jgi:ubiquinone/menaquinone biosynthesis C-methylase UbiE
MSKKKDYHLENDYERMVPEYHQGKLIYAEHVTRYLAAQDAVKGKVVLDIASGSGYGTKIISKTAKFVYGVDVNEMAINYSKKKYSNKNIEYILGDGEKIPIDNNTIDVVVTFETIEHIKNYKKFVKEIKRVLKKNGLLIISTPNDLEFAEGNHFHLHEFEYKELVSLLSKDFSFIDSYFQTTSKHVAIGTADELNNDVKSTVKNLTTKNINQHLYFYLLASNRKITEKIKYTAAIGEHYSDRALKEWEDLQKGRLDWASEEMIKLRKDIEHSQYNLQIEKNKNKELKNELNEIKTSRAWKIAEAVRKIKGRSNNKDISNNNKIT